MKREDLSWHEWSETRLAVLAASGVPRLAGAVHHRRRNLEEPKHWLHRIECKTPIAVATLINNAGIVGAALAAQEVTKHDVGSSPG